MTIKYKISMLLALATIITLATSVNGFSVYAESEIILSPYKQYQQGIPVNQIQCNDSKILVESARNTPACVNEDSVEKLLDRGFVKVTLIDTSDSTTKTKILSLTSDSYADENVVHSSYGVDSTVSALTINHIPKPILNPTNIDDLIPQDFKLEYAFKTFTDNPDVIVQKIATLHDDKITKKKYFT